jgi:hypothetical protein
MSNAKEAVIELAKTLSDECTWDDVMYQIYVRQKIEQGVADLDEGRVTLHEDLFREFKT